ncbi:PQQ-binding-like beta-propeller repeat protein, partial [Verrucomicrobiota bacterium]
MRSRRRVGMAGAAAAMMLFCSGCGTIGILMGRIRLTGPRAAIPESVAKGKLEERGPADWPKWRGPEGTGKSALKGIRTKWDGGLRQIWDVAFLCQGKRTATWSTPVVQGDRLLVPGRDTDRDLIFCLHAGTGTLLWQGSWLAPAPTGHGSGSRATPSIDGDRVYTFGRAGTLTCRRVADGSVVWRKNVSHVGGVAPKWGHSSSPLVLGNKVIVQVGGAAVTAAYDKMTGEVLWLSPAGPAAYGAPVPVNGGKRVLVFDGRGLACLDSGSGKEYWLAPWITAFGANATTPAVGGDIAFITSGYKTGGQALKMRDDGVDVLWTSKTFASAHSDPIVVGGHLYGYTGQSYQNKGDFVCFELGTGTEKWRSSEIGWGTTVYVDGHFLCLDIKGNLYLVKADTKGL